jgi:hypothetical protein
LVQLLLRVYIHCCAASAQPTRAAAFVFGCCRVDLVLLRAEGGVKNAVAIFKPHIMRAWTYKTQLALLLLLQSVPGAAGG